MKVGELIEKLSQFDRELEVTISDGYDFSFYSTNGVEFQVVEDSAVLQTRAQRAVGAYPLVLDLGVGRCKYGRQVPE